MPRIQQKKPGQGRDSRQYPATDKYLEEETSASISTSQLATEGLSEEKNMADLDVILQELRVSQRERRHVEGH